MLHIVKVFLDICMFKRGPQDMPASAFFLGIVLLANAAVGLIILSMEASFLAAVPQFLVSVILLAGFSWAVLRLSGKAVRFRQTLIALLGADTLISLTALPFLIWISMNEGFGLAYYILLGSMLWSVAVVGHIIRHALSSSYVYGLGLSILYFLGSFQAMAYLFPIAG
ncbi:MAG: hypothetical protein L0Y38_10830 [Methylococcaceae bacterium]|nr:hypothetical protein [Methylococcaceae bacterium]